jgi:predicted nucleic acid-binding Zn ribbon protein
MAVCSSCRSADLRLRGIGIRVAGEWTSAYNCLPLGWFFPHMAKRNNLIKVGDAITELFRQEKLDIKISQFTVRNSWGEIVGEAIAKSTSDISFNDKSVFITLQSAALKHELSYRKEEIITAINKYCGYRLVDHIVIR